MSGDDVTRGRVTISQAATLLGVHPNTVRKRVKSGVYDAEQMVTKNGRTWYITRESLANTSPTTPVTQGSQSLTGRVQGQDLERVLTELVRAIEKDPERENRLEAVKLRMRALQTQAAISTGLIIGMGAIVAQLENPQYVGWLYSSFAVIILSIGFYFLYMHLLATNIAIDIARPTSRLSRVLEASYLVLSLVGFGGGLVLFGIFLRLNLP